MESGKRDWDAFFFDACGDDDLIEEVAALLALWTRRGVVGALPLALGSAGDARRRRFKRTAVADLRTYGFDLRLAFEDRPNLEMFKAEGVPCVYIHSGYYD